MIGPNFGNRKKFRIPPVDILHDRDQAINLCARGDYVKAVDIYEQMVSFYPEQAVELLSELHDLYISFPHRDRYNLYQSRHFNFGINPGDKVLDIGSGHLPFPLATHLSDITLSDHQYGRAGTPFKYVDGKPVFECNIESMPFEDKEFDFVYCSHVLEHAKEPGKACRELMRVARRGYIETPSRGKDIFLSSAGVSNHSQYVEALGNCLIFTEYLPEEIEGFQCGILQDMHSAPQSKREKAFSALLYLKADLVNTMFMWEGEFQYRIVTKSSRLLHTAIPQKVNATIKTNIKKEIFEEKNLKFLQIHNFYPAYLERFYKQLPLLHEMPFKEQINALIADGFSGVHIFAPYMNELGYDSSLIIANNPCSQVMWLRENGITLTEQDNWEFEILRKQVDTIKPDILYISHPIDYDSRFIRSLHHKPNLILGWRASMIPEGTDWSEFDVMLSSLSALRDMALKIGAKASEHFFPGYPSWINDQLVDVQPEYDVVFPGSWSRGLHAGRNQILQRVAVESVNASKGFSCGYFLSGDINSIPSEVARFNFGERFGIAMHRALRSGKIALDARGILFMHDSATQTTIDLAGKETGNMRLFEATGAGVFLLAEHFDNLKEYFEPGKEIETFRSQQELVDKIRYYLAHPDKREEIAKLGQKRCLDQYSISMRAKEMDRIIAKYLSKKKEPRFSLPQSVNALKKLATELLEEDRVQEAFNILIKAKALKEPLENLDFMRALCFVRMNMKDAAIQALLEELRFFPGNQEASQLLRTIQSSVGQHSTAMIKDPEFQMILAKIRPYTMLGEARLYNLYRLARHICEHNITGNFVECGVAAGGSSALLAYVINKYSNTKRLLYSFDSFEGMPAPTADDTIKGVDAESTGWGTGTCAAHEKSLLEVAGLLGVEHLIKPVKGYFNNTLPIMRETVGTIAFMHMDADWYESIKTILDNFFDLLEDNAAVQLDDYGYWEGCSKALHEFEESRLIKINLQQIDGTAVWFQKPEAVPTEKAFNGKSEQLAPVDSISIVHLCTFSNGGAGKAAYRLHHGLVEAGLDSTLLCLSKEIADPTVKVIHDLFTSVEPGTSNVIADISNRWKKIIFDHPKRPSGLEMFSGAESPLRLSGLEEIESADIVHLHWIAGMVDYDELGILLHGKKIVWTLHDMNPFTGGCHYAGDCLKYHYSCGACPQLGSETDDDLSRQVWEKKNRALQNLDITIVTPSRWLAACAAQSAIFKDCRIVCIPNGVPTDVFRPYDRLEVRRLLGISLSAKVILFGAESLGNERKGFAYLLEALRRNSFNNTEIVLATFGSLAQDIEIDSRYKVFACGSMHDEHNLACIYSIADHMVIPSLEDNLPNTVLEAMSCGTPVVGFSIGGIPDMVEHKKTGYLAAARDVDDLMAGIDWVLFNFNSRNAGHYCRQKVESLYSIQTLVSRLKIIYHSAAQ